MEPSLTFIEALAREAGEILRLKFSGQNPVQQKGDNDLVSEADLHSEAFLIAAIRERFPHHQMIAEESGLQVGDARHRWYIDPLDGTLNYTHGVPIFAVSLAYAMDGETELAVVYNPLQEECYSAERGKGAWMNGNPLSVSSIKVLDQALLLTGFPHDVRQNPANNLDHFAHFILASQGVNRLGSAALDLCYVAAGRFDGYWEIQTNPWDIAAGGLIAQEAGGVVTNTAGDRNYLSPPYSILAANPHLYSQILDRFQD